jgi:hypothetical protein
MFYSFAQNIKNESDFDSGNESDFEDEVPTIKETRNQIMPGARLRMMRR